MRKNSITGVDQPERTKLVAHKKMVWIDVQQRVEKVVVNDEGEEETVVEYETVQEEVERTVTDRIQMTEEEEIQFDQRDEDHRQRRMGPDLLIAIEAEATRRIDAVTGDERAQSQAMARGSSLNAKVAIKGQALTVAEMAEVDQLIAVGDWVKAVRDEAERFITDDLPTLTEDEKLNFNPATHPKLNWPAQP